MMRRPCLPVMLFIAMTAGCQQVDVTVEAIGEATWNPSAVRRFAAVMALNDPAGADLFDKTVIAAVKTHVAREGDQLSGDLSNLVNETDNPLLHEQMTAKVAAALSARGLAIDAAAPDVLLYVRFMRGTVDFVVPAYSDTRVIHETIADDRGRRRIEHTYDERYRGPSTGTADLVAVNIDLVDAADPTRKRWHAAAVAVTRADGMIPVLTDLLIDEALDRLSDPSGNAVYRVYNADDLRKQRP